MNSTKCVTNHLTIQPPGIVSNHQRYLTNRRGVNFIGYQNENKQKNDENLKRKTTVKIARLTIVAKGKHFLTRIWKLVSFRKSNFTSRNWS